MNTTIPRSARGYNPVKVIAHICHSYKGTLYITANLLVDRVVASLCDIKAAIALAASVQDPDTLEEVAIREYEPSTPNLILVSAIQKKAQYDISVLPAEVLDEENDRNYG